MFQKILKKLGNLRWTWAAILAAFFLAALCLLSPQQLPVIAYKVCLLLLAGVAGYWLDRWTAPYTRPEGYLTHEWREHSGVWPDNKADFAIVAGYRRVFCAAMLRRAIILGAAMLAVGLGL